MKLFLTLLLCLTASLHAAPKSNQPNIIVIMVDDMGFSDISCYGGEIPTPNLDALAKDGLKFSQFHNTGRCCPTRASLLTGLYSHQAGIGWMTADQKLPGYRGFLAEATATIPEVLKPAGYFTAMTGKWHVGFNDSVNPHKRGFDRSLNLAQGGVHYSNQSGRMKDRKLYRNGEEIPKDDPSLSPPWYGTDLWTDQGIKYLDESLAAEKPLFLYLAHVAPHFPCMAPEKTIAKYRGKFMKGWDQLRQERYLRQIEMGLIKKEWPLPPRPKKIPAWDSLSEAEKKRYDDIMAIYAAMIEEVDRNIGKLVTALQERKQFENTLILFLSDNGGNAETGIKGKYEGNQPGDPHSNVYIGECWAHLNNTPFRKYKHYNHEGGTSTPLIAHWPAGIQANPNWIDTPTHLIDLMATCSDLSGATYPTLRNDHPIPPMEGQSLKPLFQTGGKLQPRTLFFEHEGNAAVRQGDLKLVRLGRNGPWELYNLAQDRTEQNNLAASHPEKLTALKTKWQKWAQSHQVLPYPNQKKRK